MPAKRGRTWSHELSVVGLRFRWKREGRESLGRLVAKSAIAGIRLEREPDNKYDSNAIMVLLPERMMEGAQLGYVPAESAALLAPKLDAGTLEVVSAKLIDLDKADDYNTGSMEVRFCDIAKPDTKPKTKTTRK